MTKYEFRPNSGGPGTHRGGTGLIRSYRILSDDATFPILAERERRRPWGLEGGLDGEGTEVYVTKNSRTARIPSKAGLSLDSGDEVEVGTAGGGGSETPAGKTMAEVRTDLESGLLTPSKAKKQYGPHARRKRSH